MGQVDLTFGIPLYNCEEFIGNLLDCFKKTNYFSYEIIIVDDGSTDRSLDVVRKSKLTCLNIISKRNAGVSAARNDIIKNAKGKWLTFIDSDDIIEFDKYVNIFNKVLQSNYNYHICLENKKDYNKVIKNKKRSISYIIERGIINSPCMKFFKVDVLKENHILFNKKFDLGEDLLFNMQYYNCCHDICYHLSKMYYYRKVNPLSLSEKCSKTLG